MDRPTRKAQRQKGQQWRERLAKLYDDTERKVEAAVRELKERHGAHATAALIAAEKQRIRRAALSPPEMREVRELLVQLDEAEQTRPDLTDRSRMLPRRPRMVAPEVPPANGYRSEAETAMLQFYADTMGSFTATMNRLADCIELPTYSPAELAAEAAEAVASVDHGRFAQVFRELHRPTRTGKDADHARIEVRTKLEDLPPPADLQEQLTDLDALASSRREIAQSLAAIATGDAKVRTAEDSRIIDEQGEEGYLARRTAERGYRQGQRKTPTPDATPPQIEIPISDAPSPDAAA